MSDHNNEIRTAFNTWAEAQNPKVYPAEWQAFQAGWQAALATQVGGQAQQWQPIDTAPQTGRTLLLGYYNVLGNWRTVRGQWISEDDIAEYWDDPDDVEPGWFETSVEADDVPNCWRVTPTHWQPLPGEPGTLGLCGQDAEDAARLDWLDAKSEPSKMGWRVAIAPSGSVYVGSVIQLGGKITSIREAIDAARKGES